MSADQNPVGCPAVRLAGRGLTWAVLLILSSCMHGSNLPQRPSSELPMQSTQSVTEAFSSPPLRLDSPVIFRTTNSDAAVSISNTNSPFAAYDRAVVTKIRARWYALIEENHLYAQHGTVDVYFQLEPEGTIRNLRVQTITGNSVLVHFAERAVADSVPFEPFDPRLRKLCHDKPRDIHFTFY